MSVCLAHHVSVSGGHGPFAQNVSGGGGRREESEHGSPLHRWIPRCEWSGGDPLQHHQNRSVSQSHFFTLISNMIRSVIRQPYKTITTHKKTMLDRLDTQRLRASFRMRKVKYNI